MSCDSTSGFPGMVDSPETEFLYVIFEFPACFRLQVLSL